MYKPGAGAAIFMLLFLVSAGCTSHPGQSNTTAKPAMVTEIPPTILPPLPEQYRAVPAAVSHPVPPVTTIVQSEKIPLIIPEQLTTINGSGLSGDGTNSSSTSGTTISGNSNVSVPVAQFTTSTQTGYAPLTVQFTDSSLNVPSGWSWNFGDSSFSAIQSPSHTYASGGVFQVTLTAANTAGSTTFSNTISVYAPGFSASPVKGTAPLAVNFTDTGSGAPQPTGWFWDFGDGTTCISENKIHSYTRPGTYNVAFRISGPAGDIWVNRTSLVTVT